MYWWENERYIYFYIASLKPVFIVIYKRFNVPSPNSRRLSASSKMNSAPSIKSTRFSAFFLWSFLWTLRSLFALKFTYLNLVDSAMSVQILARVEDFFTNYACRPDMLLHMLLKQIFVLFSCIADIANKTVRSLTCMLSFLVVRHVVLVHHRYHIQSMKLFLAHAHLEMQQKSMVHFNSLNLGDVWIYCEIHLN